jgi:hypothetical protein
MYLDDELSTKLVDELEKNLKLRLDEMNAEEKRTLKK